MDSVRLSELRFLIVLVTLVGRVRLVPVKFPLENVLMIVRDMALVSPEFADVLEIGPASTVPRPSCVRAPPPNVVAMAPAPGWPTTLSHANVTPAGGEMTVPSDIVTAVNMGHVSLLTLALRIANVHLVGKETNAQLQLVLDFVPTIVPGMEFALPPPTCQFVSVLTVGRALTAV